MTNSVMRLAQPLSVLLAPVLAYQGWRIKRNTPLLPEAEVREGTVPGSGTPLRLLLVGDSLAAGVGVDHNEHALAGHLAALLARQSGRPVTWQVMGKNGATARSAGKYLTSRAPDLLTGWSPDVAVVIVGINDLIRFRRLEDWARTTAFLAHNVRRALADDALVMFCGIPPVARFPALPQPLRTVMAIRANLMDQRLKRTVEELGARHVPLPPEKVDETEQPFFSRDRFHPSAYGYEVLATAFSPVMAAWTADREKAARPSPAAPRAEFLESGAGDE
ncbi:SGNH/GDSL hydrolase family protein [Streptomyces sp. RKCA744]|uniref:SGNH/GDSL hydrolase family protein n=1 Tax=Streptomyces sp. RKCA744 TaxID=2959340 RepID=UPI0020A12237|nr:SGNH/GDSL hydrolase family protein [Streptomyces sp. RKCA744]MCO8308812.1 SGNH/GDSL hydrolase family protein [Streptomyces sp. RKCA744]